MECAYCERDLRGGCAPYCPRKMISDMERAFWPLIDAARKEGEAAGAAKQRERIKREIVGMKTVLTLFGAKHRFRAGYEKAVDAMLELIDEDIESAIERGEHTEGENG